jgi:hypothetical protein
MSLLASSPRPATSAPTPEALENVQPEHGWMSHIALYRETGQPEGEAFPGSGGSLYHSSRSLLPPSPMVEYQPNSAYVSARSATSAGLVSAAQESLYSSLATPTARVPEAKAVPNRPEQLEVVKPLIDGNK